MSEVPCECSFCRSLRKCDNFRKEKLFTDVTFQVNGIDFPAHRMVLSSQSPYFKSLLVTESGEATAEDVVISVVDSETFSVVIECMYGHASLNVNNIYQVTLAAELFCVSGVLGRCLDYIAKKWAEIDADEVYKLAVRFNLDEMKLKFEQQLDFFLGKESQECFSPNITYIAYAYTKSGRPLGDPEMAFTRLHKWVCFKSPERIPLLRDIFDVYPLVKVNELFVRNILEELCVDELQLKNRLLFKLKTSHRCLNRVIRNMLW